jgi:hypothetical protein
MNFMLGLFFDPENIGYMFVPNVKLIFNGMYSVISQKIKFVAKYIVWAKYTVFMLKQVVHIPARDSSAGIAGLPGFDSLQARFFSSPRRPDRL